MSRFVLQQSSKNSNFDSSVKRRPRTLLSELRNSPHRRESPNLPSHPRSFPRVRNARSHRSLSPPLPFGPTTSKEEAKEERGERKTAVQEESMKARRKRGKEGEGGIPHREISNMKYYRDANTSMRISHRGTTWICKRERGKSRVGCKRDAHRGTRDERSEEELTRGAEDEKSPDGKARKLSSAISKLETLSSNKT